MEKPEKILGEIKDKQKKEKADTKASRLAKIRAEIMNLEDMMSTSYEIFIRFLINENDFLKKLKEMYREGRFSEDIIVRINNLIKEIEEKIRFIKEAGELMKEAVEKFCSININIDDVLNESRSEEEIQRKLAEMGMKCYEEMKQYRNYINSLSFHGFAQNLLSDLLRDSLEIVMNIVNCEIPVKISLGNAGIREIHSYLTLGTDPEFSLFVKLRNEVCKDLVREIRSDVEDAVECLESLTNILQNLKNLIESMIEKT